jgi:hypothetical protein
MVLLEDYYVQLDILFLFNKIKINTTFHAKNAYKNAHNVLTKGNYVYRKNKKI